MLICAVGTSAPEGRRYGEPDWERRPVDFQGTGVWLFGHQIFSPQHPSELPKFPKYTEQSYEEWKVEGLVKK